MEFNSWRDVLEYYELPHHSNAPCEDKKITDIHIYDFDGTMFFSPSISNDLFTTRARKYLMPFNGMKNSGGWWCYQYSLETYIDNWIAEKTQQPKTVKSEKGVCHCDQCKIDHKYWSYDIIQKISKSSKQSGCLTVMMTGRREDKFQETFKKLLKGDVFNRTIFHQELDFDCIFLKKDYQYTMQYKVNVIVNLMNQFPLLKSILMYDDREDQIVGMEAWWQKQHKRIKFNIIPVIPKVGQYDYNQHLDVVKGLVSTHNKNTPEQIINVDAHVEDDIYYAIDKGVSRFLMMLTKLYIEWDDKSGILGIQMINGEPAREDIDWIISKLKFSNAYGCFLELHNKTDSNQKAVIITHYIENHLKTYKHIMEHDVLNTFDEEIDINYETSEKYTLSQTMGDLEVNEKINLNDELKFTFLNLDDGVLSFKSDMTQANKFMLVDMSEES